MSGPSTDGLSTPAVVVDLDVLERNIRRMAVRAREAGVRLRPHAKTHKCPQIARLQRAAGAGGLSLAKVGLAEAFADAGLDDLFVAFPVVGEDKGRRLLALSTQCALAIASCLTAGPPGPASRLFSPSGTPREWRAGSQTTRGPGGPLGPKRIEARSIRTSLPLLKHPSCVGWHWFRYQDNDPYDLTADPSNRDSNKGIVSINFEPYADLLTGMKAVNDRAYSLQEFFATKGAPTKN